MKLCVNGKTCHESLLAAEQKLQVMLKHRTTSKDTLAIYKCKMCKCYHIGNSKQNREDNKK